MASTFFPFPGVPLAVPEEIPRALIPTLVEVFESNLMRHFQSGISKIR